MRSEEMRKADKQDNCLKAPLMSEFIALMRNVFTRIYIYIYILKTGY